MTVLDKGRAVIWVSLGTTLIAGIGFAAHTTFTLGEIKGSLDRDLVHSREQLMDHEQRIRQLELVKRQ